MSDLLDVLHALFEEAQDADTQEALRAREHLRKGIYTKLYGYKQYSWVSPESDSPATASSGGTGADMIPMDEPVDPSKIKLTHKPYVPPTPIDVDSPLPIAGLKEAPLG
jgi:hypothetical protein